MHAFEHDVRLPHTLFGVAGALLAIPVVAMLLTLLDLYRTRYDVLPQLEDEFNDGVPSSRIAAGAGGSTGADDDAATAPSSS